MPPNFKGRKLYHPGNVVKADFLEKKGSTVALTTVVTLSIN